jgi:hypothetical protein
MDADVHWQNFGSSALAHASSCVIWIDTGRCFATNASVDGIFVLLLAHTQKLLFANAGVHGIFVVYFDAHVRARQLADNEPTWVRP